MIMDKDEVSAKVKVYEHLRMDFNFSDSLDAKTQGLLNALGISVVLPIYWHTLETYILLHGKIRVAFYYVLKRIPCLINEK